MKRSALVMLGLLALIPSVSAATDPTFLECTVADGTTVQGIVLMRRLKKLRVWYSDDSGREWTDVDYSKPTIATNVLDGDSVALSKDLRTATFHNKGEKSAHGRCKVASMKGAPKSWFAPVLKQPWEKD